MGGNDKKRRLTFQDHRRELGENAYVYPVVSRRSGGLSVGINLNPDKICNFDCPYCQVDRKVKPRFSRVDTDRLLRELDDLLALAQTGSIWQFPPFDTVSPAHRRLCDIAFSGDGEPTSFGPLAALMDSVAELRNARSFEQAPLVLISNASLFHKARVAQALERLAAHGGRVWAKLDAGTQSYFQWVCGTEHSLDLIVENITSAAKRHPLTIQSMFLNCEGTPAGEAELEAWTQRLRQIQAGGGQIEGVQVYTVARKPADTRLTALPPSALEGIALRARALGLKAEIFP
jgi:wyosine [tRNA(Phe)-imidazoG37] synthetase (radical SAM superfamily)